MNFQKVGDTCHCLIKAMLWSHLGYKFAERVWRKRKFEISKSMTESKLMVDVSMGSWKIPDPQS